ncbi:protein ILRUN [Aplysia californica]|uniref:Protein ILRUN n=1 Tax=Aplysia californica TaxID=6500 RepID=A0ABM0K1T3_APLCA|nr:protein ILRUN [Aplysia californica]
MDVDIDNDFDGKFLDQFRSMGTTDRDVLIAEFQAVLGNQINPESCAFFLDMNNWNLQNAVCSYYDFEQPTNLQPSMSVLGDLTIGDGESVAPSTTFIKTWKIKNQGMDRWPPGCHLRFCSGDNLSTVERRMVDALLPGEELDVSIEMRSPAASGAYHSMWRMSTATGIYFGDVINVQVMVAEGGLLGLTQQLARIGGTPGQVSIPNPFPQPAGHHSSSMDAATQPQPQPQPQQQQIVLFSGGPAAGQMQQQQDPTGGGGLERPAASIEEDTDMS